MSHSAAGRPGGQSGSGQDGHEILREARPDVLPLALRDVAAEGLDDRVEEALDPTGYLERGSPLVTRALEAPLDV
jgi:hypothetical protein